MALRISTYLGFLLLAGCAQPSIKDTYDLEFYRRYKFYDYCSIKMVRQSQSHSCGLACLTVVLNYWGIEAREKELLKSAPGKGALDLGLHQLKGIAEERGLQAFVYCMDDDPETQLCEQINKGRPVICCVQLPSAIYLDERMPMGLQWINLLLWNLGPRASHYVVVFGKNKTNYLLLDPAYGVIKIDRVLFESCWAQKEHSVLLGSI